MKFSHYPYFIIRKIISQVIFYIWDAICDVFHKKLFTYESAERSFNSEIVQKTLLVIEILNCGTDAKKAALRFLGEP